MSDVAVFLFDSFPARRFSGNIAGVVLLEEPASREWMHQVAGELAAPTTGFVDLPSAREGAALVRFFTPVKEINACGHVTVAIATLLVEAGIWRLGEATVVAAGGSYPLETRRRDNGRILVEMRQHLQYLQRLQHPRDLPGIARILGAAVLDVRLPTVVAGTGLRHLLVPVTSVSDLGQLPLRAVDIAMLSAALDVDTIGVFTVLGQDDTGVQVQMRDLCAGIGATEEPASGTTTGTLAFALADAGLLTVERPRLAMQMGMEIGRPSRLTVRLDFRDGRPHLARLQGESWRVLTGHLVAETLPHRDP